MKLNTVIIDDEPDAHKLLEYYCKQTGFISVVGNYFSATEAIGDLERIEPDFILLDINMSEISGIQMLDLLKRPERIILTTAHPEYALEGYDYNVLDYLLKPFRYERFLKSIERIKSIKYPNQTQLPSSIRLSETNFQLFPAQIVYIEAFGNYVKIFTYEKNRIIELITMKALELRLAPYGFFRCHKKYMVNKNYVSKMDENKCTMIDGSILPVGISYRQKVKSLHIP